MCRWSCPQLRPDRGDGTRGSARRASVFRLRLAGRDAGRHRVGTSSLRREAALRSRYPQLVIKPLRGNLDTRLGKLDRGEYGAIILAAAGLKRLGLGERIRALIPIEVSLPAAGQGALGIEIPANRPELAPWLAP